MPNDLRVTTPQADQIEPDPLPAYVRGLLNPAAYPQPPERVDLVQTHISYVFLAGDAVYKTKKPVDFGFINQVAPERREFFCHEEVRLNSRLAPDVYVGVVPVTRLADGRYTVDPAATGEVVEWAVQMHRLSDDRTLDHLLTAHVEPPGIAATLAQRLLAFHEAAEVVRNDPGFAGAPAEHAWWAREYSEAEQYIGDTWRADDAATTSAFIAHALDTHAALFDERLAGGRVVDGHGDLQAKHVYVLDATLDHAAERLAIVDCIEFTDWFHFRYLDVGYDIAFLAMDLEAQGRADLGDELAGRYIAAAHDETMGVLQPLHRAFRAFVRGKVESIGAHATEVPADVRAHLATSAARYFRLAATYAQRATAPALIVMSGLPGTGKSTVAATLAGHIGAAYLSSDTVRKQLAGIDPRTRADDQYHAGLYAPDMHQRTYEELRRRAAVHLAAGRPVVLDAMHGRADERAAAIALAVAHGVPALIAELRLDDEAARERIDGRADDPYRTSDATWEVYRQQAAAFEAPDPTEGTCLALDATQTPAALALEIAATLRTLR